MGKGDIGHLPAGERPNLPSVIELEAALNDIVKKGLPLNSLHFAKSGLVSALPREIRLAAEEGDASRVVAHLDAFLRRQLDEFEVEELRHVACILFAHAPGTKGTNLTMRREKIAKYLKRDSDYSVRTAVQPKIVTALAWQIYRFANSQL